MVRYTARLALRPRVYDLPPTLGWDAIAEGATAALDSTRIAGGRVWALVFTVRVQ